MHLISLSLIVFAQALLLHVFGFPDGKFALEPSTFAIDARSDVNSPGIALHRRQLVAARSTDELKARDSAVNGFLGNSHILHFIDDSQASPNRDTGYEEQAPFAAHVHLTSTLPTLLLEDGDPHFDQITCYGSSIELSFRSTLLLSLAWNELNEHHEILVIVSHPGCNTIGEHRPLIVSGTKKLASSLVLTVAPANWKDSFHSIDVHFGTGAENNLLKPHQDLRKRQSSPSSTSLSAATSSINFPPKPVVSPTSTSVANANVNKQYLDTTILPPKFPGVDGVSLHGPFVPHGLTIGCKNCTIQGNIDLSQGSFTVRNPNIPNIEDFYNNGFVELQVNNFAAHIELQSTVQASASVYTFVAPFPDIAIPGFNIPGIAEVGPVLRPRVSFGAQISTALDFTYGFNLSVPDQSTIKLDIQHPENSTVTGFQDTKISALPFQSQVDSINLTLSAAFTPQLLLTISVLDNHGTIGAGAFLDLPSLSATIAQVDHVNAKCEPMANATDNAKDFPFKSLTQVIPKVEADVGVIVDAALAAGEFSVNASAAYTAWSTGYPLPTACFSYDPQAKTYGTPKLLLQSIAGVGAKNPLSGVWGRWERMTGTAVVVGLIFVVLL